LAWVYCFCGTPFCGPKDGVRGALIGIEPFSEEGLRLDRINGLVVKDSEKGEDWSGTG
jgi:hypothetical protein